MFPSHGPPTLISSILVFSLLCFHIVASDAAKCDGSTYGKPEKSDCQNLFDKFTRPQSLQARFFDEEQLRVDSEDAWPGVDNVFQLPIVQLPKFFAMSMYISHTWENTCSDSSSFESYDDDDDALHPQIPVTLPSCRIRILQRRRSDRWTLAVGPSSRRKARCLYVIAWISSLAVVRSLSNRVRIFLPFNCIVRRDITLVSNLRCMSSADRSSLVGTSVKPVLVIFMWASGAKFENKLNQYENDPFYSPQLSLAAVGLNRTGGGDVRVLL